MRKPAGWPNYMVAKVLASGAVGYYWAPPTWAKKRGCTLKAENLGTDYCAAKARCDDILNKHFIAWRKGEETAETAAAFGSFDWLVAVYKATPRYTKRPAKTRKSYDDALALISKHHLKDGRPFGAISIASITPGAADVLFEKLKINPTGKPRPRAAVLAMVVAKIAWNAARRAQPKAIPLDNPFAKMQLDHQTKPTRAPTHDELLRFVAAADMAGEPSIGTAAMIAFYWLQREGDVLARLSWAHYRPADNPTVVKIWHHKTRAQVDLPLLDDDGSSLWPELMERLETTPHRGTLIVTRDRPDRVRKVNLPWTLSYFQHRFAAIRSAAGIDSAVKFMGMRHGGNTEGADAGLSDAQLRALSGHKSQAMVLVYARDTMKQRREGARKRRDSRTKKEEMSE